MKYFSVFLVLILIFLLKPELSICESQKSVVFNKEDISKMGILSIVDLLNQVAGVKCGDSSISIRGSYSVLVFVDGRTINDPSSSHGQVKWDLVSLETIEKVEVLVGKGGLEYGSEAGAGVVIITTKKIDLFKCNFKSCSGNFNTYLSSSNLLFDLGNTGFGIFCGFEKTDSYRINSDSEKKKATLKLEYLMGNKTNIILSGGYITEKKGLSGTIENPTPYSRKKSDMYSSSLHIKNPVFCSKTSIGNVEVRNSDSSKSTNSKLDVRKIKQNFSGSLKTETMGNFHSGLGVYKGMVSSSQYGEHDEDIFHIFISDSFNLLDMDFGLGARLNNYSEFENTLTHEFKVAKNIETCSLTFLYNRSNTIPSFYKRYNETSSTKPNPDLQMEISDNFSITSTYRHEKMFTLMGTIFYNSLTDRITYEKSSDGTGSYKNTGKASYKGVEVSTAIALKPVLMKLSYMYMEARDDITDLFLTSRPLNRANFYIFFTIMSNLTFAVDIKYTGKQYDNKENTEFVEEYTIANLKLEYKGSGYNIFGEIKNVTDKSYIYADGIEGRPLTYMAGINFKF